MPRLAALGGLFRLLHPFPSVLCAVATGSIATLAGADATTVARLFLAMLAMQVSIGALNDLVDAPHDAAQKPRKPIPSGLVTRPQAGIIAIGGGALGLILSALSDPAAGVAGAGGLALGYAYDLRLSRTALSWLPLSLALPLLPMYAWLGGTGSLPAGLLPLVPVGILAGGGLALANGLVDVDRDTSVQRRSLVVRLGARRTLLIQGLALGAAVALALLMAPEVSSPGGLSDAPAVFGALREFGLALGALAIAIGAVVLASPRAGMRERGWELEAIGVAMIGIGWLAGIAAAARGGAGA